MPRFALHLEYAGTAFAGWWRQPDLRTVAGELDAAFARLGETQAAAVGASRTDAGVHARGQVAHVDCARAWHPADLVHALNHHLSADLACRGVAAVADDWHAVHAAIGKTYRYRLHLAPRRDPFLAARIAWRLPFACDLAALREAAAPLRGVLDLRAFARRGEYRDDLRTELAPIRWYERDGYAICRVRGTRFAYRLVRSLVGGMVAVAHGSVSQSDWEAALAGQVSAASAQQAPAHGLCLERVHYATPLTWCASSAIGAQPIVPRN